MSSLVSKLKKNKKLMVFHESELPDVFITGNLPALDVLFSGKIKNGGIKKGAISQIAADSTLGKTIVGLHYLAEAQKEGMDCFVIDTERSFPRKLATALGIDLDNLIIYDTQIISEVKQILENISLETTRETRSNVFVLLDSWGDLVSTQVLEKAADGSSAVDMGATSKFKNELANILHACGFTTLVINHVYASLSPYMDPKNIPGGTRLYFNSDAIALVMSAKKYKDDDKNVLGKICNAYIKKGRDGAENSNVKYRILTKGGIDPWFGFLEDFQEAGVVQKEKPGQYYRVDIDVDKSTGEITKTFKEEETYTREFVKPLLENEKFTTFIEKKYHYDDTLIALKDDKLDKPAQKNEVESSAE